MKKTLATLLLIALTLPVALTQERVYRCGNEYTNNATRGKARGCKLIEGGYVTVLQGNRPATAPAPGPTLAAAGPSSAPRVSSSDQKARDSDARAILEAELRKAEARHAELIREYNDGTPEHNALDLRNPQRYAERTAELKAGLSRSESDIAGIKRELARQPAASASAN
ncbi:hypothetical protein D5039_00345 [Verminephrobacter aporrectodeae subsp. tuberculatae]|uniref:Uncharacterized protein n=1 Tax=Verminephrobacter aporrectodeae subsp. tuberculatae TaxID=1110392 RepID=A0ABT3KMZ9_9BURK|nr:hypothetical protein [Verminephrobacter aporrectodeae]MCW5319682.1 hypothetical protein [Verminephrobacter aporrectodeae subsp. tuberculatae]